MNCDEDTKRAKLVELSHQLLSDGLVVRTWGNFSVRGSADEFLITPSGRRYETMTEEELALCTGPKEWSGPYKPSSEYPMHALTYRLFPQARWVIHTHQPYASALSLAKKDFALDDEAQAALGQEVLPVAPYGLPSTKKLHRGVEETLQRTGAQVILMKAHGAMIWAESACQARRLANALEKVAKDLYQRELSCLPSLSARSLTSQREGEGDGLVWVDEQGRPTTPDAATQTNHLRIYRQRPDVGAIVTCHHAQVADFFGGKLPAYLDDFAQIIGLKADDTTRGNAVLTNSAAYCIGADLDAAHSAQIVLEKNALAARYARVCGAKPLKKAEALLMREIYRRKYSKQAG